MEKAYETFQCDTCSELGVSTTFAKKSSIERHQLYVHSVAKCDICSGSEFQLYSKSGLERHHKDVHEFYWNREEWAGKIRKKYMRTEYGKTDNSTQKPFVGDTLNSRPPQIEMNPPVKVEAEEIEVECSDCPARLESSRALTRHRLQIHGLKTDKRIKVEKADKLFDCKPCSEFGVVKQFTLKSSLNLHMRTVHNHGIIKVECVTCRVQGFQQKTFSLTDLTRHHQEVHGMKCREVKWKLSCEICQKKCGRTGHIFLTIDHLISHQKDEHSQVVFLTEQRYLQRDESIGHSPAATKMERNKEERSTRITPPDEKSMQTECEPSGSDSSVHESEIADISNSTTTSTSTNVSEVGRTEIKRPDRFAFFAPKSQEYEEEERLIKAILTYQTVLDILFEHVPELILPVVEKQRNAVLKCLPWNRPQ